jgi:hypothetical protein
LRQINIIPELNFWFRRELSNATVYDTYHKIPVEVSDIWREPRSVIELLFNETFDPGISSSSSSSDNIESANDKPYIYLYRRVNLLSIQDKIVLNRIQPYRWWANVYAANSMKFIDLFDMQGSQLDPSFYNGNEVYLPYDIDEEDRSPYITYQTFNGSFSNYPLWQQPSSVGDDNTDQPPIVANPDIFDFTDLTLQMLDKLYLYKINESVHINDITYEELDSCLAKLIYIYLDAFLNDSYVYYDTVNSISNGNDILCSLYEKYVLDMVYLLRQKSYGVIWNETNVVNTSLVNIKEDFFIILKKEILRTRITEEVLNNGKFTLTGNHLPWDRRDFTFFKDGVILEQDQDFTITVDVEDPTNIKVDIILLRDDFEENELVEFIWSYANPHSAYSEEDS